MTYQEKNITVFLMNNILIFGYYLTNVVRMVQENSFNSLNIFSLWGAVIVLMIIITIISVIVTQIVFAIIHQIKTNEEPTFIEDERDKLIELRGTRNAYGVFSLGVFAAMLSLVLGQPSLVMFNLLIASSFASEIFGNISRLYFYRRGF
ncbi:MAG: hypothetical protein OEZ02_02980 [Anaerolineae bacterium]|nr:hypothetical protein [Anaerolineae bacterium]